MSYPVFLGDGYFIKHDIRILSLNNQDDSWNVSKFFFFVAHLFPVMFGLSGPFCAWNTASKIHFSKRFFAIVIYDVFFWHSQRWNIWGCWKRHVFRDFLDGFFHKYSEFVGHWVLKKSLRGFWTYMVNICYFVEQNVLMVCGVHHKNRKLHGKIINPKDWLQ